jgi:hypothetical protein
VAGNHVPPNDGCATHKVVEIPFAWSDDGLLRHTVFVGLREDKQAKEVRREKAK